MKASGFSSLLSGPGYTPIYDTIIVSIIIIVNHIAELKVILYFSKVLCGRRCEDLLSAKLENNSWDRRKTYGGKIHHRNSE